MDRSSTPTSLTGAVLSALTVMQDGNAIEVATIGIEGLVGHYGFGGMSSPHRVIAQIGNGALRIEARALQEEGAKTGPLRDLLTAYHIAFMSQVSQSVACNGLHRLSALLSLAAYEPRPGGLQSVESNT